jgi:acetyl-CoA carboxylase biotin carboxyl carrier protein
MAKFELDTDFVRKLAEILQETSLGEIELADGERSIRVARQAVTFAAAAPVQAAAPFAAPPGLPAAATAGAPVECCDLSKHPGAVKSPMVGTAYLAPEPGKPPYVNLGDKVAAGQTLLIIEAMKTFNPIKAPKAGTVMQILIENAQAVEFGEPMMIVQ